LCDIAQKLLSQNIRVTTDLRNEKIGAKIREGRLDLVPYLAVVGAKETENNSVALRSRKDGELGEVKIDDLIVKLNEEIKERRL
jgi:threonyl-tRNA synthetase